MRARLAFLLLLACGRADAAECQTPFDDACRNEAEALRLGDGVARDPGRARAMLKEQCDAIQNVPVKTARTSASWAPCRTLATMASRGVGGKRDDATAHAVYDHACGAGDLESCVADGELWMARQEPKRALARLDAACQTGAGRGCATLGLGMLRGDFGTANVDGGLALMKKACSGSEPETCNILAVYYGDRSTPSEALSSTLAVFHDGCAKDTGSACYAEAVYLRMRADAQLEGDGDEPGPKRRGLPNPRIKPALALFDKACRLGERRACHDLGVFAERGTFGKPDAAEAKRRYTRACTLGFGLACFNLGVEETKRDRASAEKYLTRACGLDEDRGCLNLGYLLLDGSEAEQKRATALLDELCARDEARACNKLGLLSLAGQGTMPMDTAAAKQWFERACAHGLPLGCQNARLLEAK